MPFIYKVLRASRPHIHFLNASKIISFFFGFLEFIDTFLSSLFLPKFSNTKRNAFDLHEKLVDVISNFKSKSFDTKKVKSGIFNTCFRAGRCNEEAAEKESEVWKRRNHETEKEERKSG